MKKFFIYSVAMTMAMAAFTSCSDNDDNNPDNSGTPETPGASIPAQTYITGDNLTLSLDGQPLVGKTITFTPKEDGTAEITLAGASLPLDFDAMLGGSKAGVEIKTAGVLPGSPSVTIPVTLEGEADNCTFSGTGETDYCTYSYSGSATADDFTFSLSDVKLKNQSLVGTWNLCSMIYGDDSVEFANTFRCNWVSSEGIDIGFGIPMSISTVASLALLMTTVDFGGEQTQVAMLLEKVLKSVTFDEAGNITAEYLDTENMTWQTAPKGIAQYVVTGDGEFKLYLNVQAIMAFEMTKSRAEGEGNEASAGTDIMELISPKLAEMLPTLIPMAQEMLENGIPLHYGEKLTSEGEYTDDATAFYLGTETLLPLLKMALPIIEDENVVNAIVALASKDKDMESMADMLPGILNSLPAIINQTTVVEIGINMKK